MPVAGSDDGSVTVDGYFLVCADLVCSRILATSDTLAPQPAHVALEKDPEGQYRTHVGPTEWIF